MSFARDPRLMDAKALPMAELVARMGIAGLRRQGAELVGPCPLCGGTPGKADRFAINLRSNLFLCRKCDLRGGDQIALVMQILNLSFPEALSWLCGDQPAEIDPIETARRRKRAAHDQRRQEDIAKSMRRRAIADAAQIWRRSTPATGTLVQDYLAHRGLGPDVLPVLPPDIRFIADHPMVKRIKGQLITAHRGPAMVARITVPPRSFGPGSSGLNDPVPDDPGGRDGRGSAVHQTWLDLSQPNGKAVLSFAGDDLPAKMVRGSKKAGAIRLLTPASADTLVMGEGIETTLSALVASPIANTAYWAGIDLGNMSGRMQKKPGKRYSGLPDMSDIRAFVPPLWVKRLVFIMDGDSEPNMTRAKLECGLKRAMAIRKGLKAQIVQAGDGIDLNDVLRGAA